MYTRNPKPETRNPNPETLNPERYTRWVEAEQLEAHKNSCEFGYRPLLTLNTMKRENHYWTYDVGP